MEQTCFNVLPNSISKITILPSIDIPTKYLSLSLNLTIHVLGSCNYDIVKCT